MKAIAMLKIGELAKQTGVSVGTLRYYGSLGLLVPSQRSESGYRYYADDAIEKVQFIRKAQALQFSLADIKQILDIREQGYPVCHTVKALLNQKIEQVNLQIEQLDEFKVELEKYRNQWAERSLDQPNSAKLCSLIDEVATPSLIPDSVTPESPTSTKKRHSP